MSERPSRPIAKCMIGSLVNGDGSSSALPPPKGGLRIYARVAKKMLLNGADADGRAGGRPMN